MIKLQLKVIDDKIYIQYHDKDVRLREASLFLHQLERVKKDVMKLEFESEMSIREEIPYKEDDKSGDNKD